MKYREMRKMENGVLNLEDGLRENISTHAEKKRKKGKISWGHVHGQNNDRILAVCGFM